MYGSVPSLQCGGPLLTWAVPQQASSLAKLVWTNLQLACMLIDLGIIETESMLHLIHSKCHAKE